MLKKDKEKVLDEVWTDDRIRSFLDLKAPAHLNPDFHCLMTAYKSMRLEDFEKFVTYFKEAGKKADATDDNGKTVAEIISTHRYGKDYAKLIS